MQMRFVEEIHKAVRHQHALDTNSTKTEDELRAIEEAVCTAISAETYDFSNSESIVLKQSGGKKRFVKQYTDVYSPESVLCQCIKQILDRSFRVKYPNRNKSVRALFDTLKAVRQMADFTIIKYDFKDFFNSVSTPYVFEKYLAENLTDRFEADLVKRFAKETKYAYAGFSTSNVIAEIIAQRFDSEVSIAFDGKGLLFFDRYIDDSIIIVNQHIEEVECRKLLEDTLDKVFHDNTITEQPKCKTHFNSSKFRYVSRRMLTGSQKTIDYLGYEFKFKTQNDKTEIKYGITQAKIDKYNRRIDEIIRLYKNPVGHNGEANPDYQKMELLRHRIAAFTSRSVYRISRYNTIVWKTKGFIGNYGELRYLLDTPLIDARTKTFLERMVENAFQRALLPIPYFLKGLIGKNGYNLFDNMKTNKTLLFVDKIGCSKHALENLCAQIEINTVDRNGKTRGYGQLVREYLIKVKVGY
jgi:hypothetical protein